VYVGLIRTGHDITGVYFAYGWFSGALRDSQRAAGQPGQEYESILELNYRWNALPWFYLQPDIQESSTRERRTSSAMRSCWRCVRCAF